MITVKKTSKAEVLINMGSTKGHPESWRSRGPKGLQVTKIQVK